VAERSRRPRHSPRRTSAEKEDAIVALRQRWPDWGAPKLQTVLLREHPDWKMTVRTVHRILDRQGLIQAENRHRPAFQRFEREEANELRQMDFKGASRVQQRGAEPDPCRCWTIIAGIWPRCAILGAPRWTG
jgi:hypothetical protein